MPEPIVDIDIQSWNELRRSNSSALSALYDRYFPLLYNYGRKIGADERTLEDAIHDLFVDLWRYRQNIAPTSSVKFYLYRSLRRRLVRNGEKDFLLLAGEDGLLQSVPCLEQELIEQETHTHQVRYLRKLMNDLSPRQYEAMVLRFYDELSFEEIGSILQVNEQSARNLVQRGLAQLRQFSKLMFTAVFFCAFA